MSFANYRRHTTWALPALPDLWAEAKRLLARALAHTGAAQEIARKAHLSRSSRREIVLWIEPVEKMVRGVIAARAVIHLLMTPEGRKLLREARRDYAPEPDPEPPPPKPASPSRRIIPHPGWHTIWQPPPRPAPTLPSPPSLPADTGPGPDPGDPSSWSCPYRVVSRTRAQALPVALPEPRRGPRISLLDDWVAPPRPRPAAADNSANANSTTGDSASASKLALRYARRIETLRRVIDNPGPAIRRLAGVLARTAPDDLDLPRWRNEAARQRWLNWRQGDLYADQAREHALLALRALHRSLDWLDRPADDPG